MITDRKAKFIQALPTAKSATDAARTAGYSPKTAKHKAYQLLHDKDVQDRIQNLGEVGLNTLETVAKEGRVEIARVQAAKTLVETAYGKPKDNKQNQFGDITINIAKLGDLSNLLKSTG